MAKTLAQGRKPGSGRKPGKGKTLKEGRKPGSGRRRRVDEYVMKGRDDGLHGSQSCNEHEWDCDPLSARDIEAADALRGLNTSPSQQQLHLSTPDLLSDPTRTDLQFKIGGNELAKSPQELVELNRNLDLTNVFLYTKNHTKQSPNVLGVNELKGILDTRVPVTISITQDSKSHEQGNNANQKLGKMNAAEKVLVST